MKRWALLAMLPLLGWAGERDDYARQWPLSLSREDGGAYRVVLDREVYRSIHAPALEDLEVFNAEGAAVPAALFAAEQPLAQAARRVALPWFPLPAAVASPGAEVDLSVISQRDAAGTVLRVETRRAQGSPSSAARSPSAFLVDASQLREPILALALDWEADGPALDLGYRVEGSDDLRRWRVLDPDARLIDLARGGDRLRQQRIPVGVQVRYLRLIPLRDVPAPVLTAMHAEIQAPPVVADWAWETLAGRRVAEQGRVYFEFDLQGRFPVERIDLDLAGNDAVEWTLSSRDSPSVPWRHRTGPWVAYRLQGEAGGSRSAPQALAAPVRDRYWRLSPSQPSGEALPALRLGYRPEAVVFLAQGAPPYALAAGSAHARRVQAPIPRMLAALREQYGADWQPVPADLGPATELAGEAALQPAPAARDWKAWLLWSLLVAGAGLVAAFALTLLRRRS